MPKLSVIVPVYNVAPYLNKCIDSILCQTFSDFELILVCDGPNDDMEICEKYCSKDDRVILIKNIRKGLGGARNAGLDVAKGDFVIFIDSDDWVETDFFEKMLHPALSDEQIDIVQCGTKIVFDYTADEQLKENDETYFQITESGKEKVDNSLYGKINVGTWNKLYKKSLIDKYRLRFPRLRNEDAYFTWCYWSVSNSIFYVQEKLYNYRRRNDSLMARTFQKCLEKNVLDHLKVSELFYKFLKKNNMYDNFTEGYWKSYQVSCWFVACNGDDKRKKEGFFMAKKFLKNKRIPNGFEYLKKIKKMSYDDFKLNRPLHTSKLKFAGLTLLKKIKSEKGKRVLLFGCIPTYSTENKNGKIKRKFFGIQFNVRHKNKVAVKGTRFSKKDSLFIKEKGKCPKISIILPIYNVEQYLKKCITSVLNQSLSDIEVILGTDGPEACDKICEDFAKKDSRVKIVYHPGSYGKACNQGIKLATGEYVGFVETDDWCDPDMFAKLYLTAKKSGADVCKGGFINAYDDEKCNSVTLFTSDDSVFNIKDRLDLLAFQPSIWSAIYKTDFLRKNGITMIEERMPFIDAPFHMETLLKAKKVASLAEPLYYYYHGNPNQSVQNEKASFAGLKAEELFYAKNPLNQSDIQTASATFAATLAHLRWDYERLVSEEFKAALKRQIVDFFKTLPIQSNVDKSIVGEWHWSFYESMVR